MTLKIKIISGGQTGADRAALDFALEYGVDCGGFCPKDRRSEDGAIPARYPLTETKSADYPERTEKNLRIADGTVVISISATLTGGSKKTATLAARHKKPFLHLSRQTPSPAQALADFVKRHKIGVLNVAGPRESKEPGVGSFVAEVLQEAFQIK